MKLYIEDDDGNKTELKELEETLNNNDILIFKTNVRLLPERTHDIAKQLERNLNKKCIVLDSTFDKVYGINK